MLSPAIQPLVSVIEAFLSRAIDAPTFERRYLDTDYACGHEPWTEAEYQILQELFWAVDGFVADPALRDSDDDLSEEQLRAEAARVLQALRALPD